MSSEGKHIVFVYGTLKSGLRNHYILSDPDPAKLLGLAETVQKFPLIVASEFHCPFLLQAEGKGEHVEGEVYEIDDHKLASLDELERHPHFYQRLLTKVKLVTEDSQKDNATVLDCWAYFITAPRQELLDLPMLKNYSSSAQFKSLKLTPEQRAKRQAALHLFIKGET